MGQKIHPISLRLQHSNRYFDSCWYSDFYYAEIFSREIEIAHYINSVLKQAQYPAGRIYIQNSTKKTKIIVFFCSPLQSRSKRSEFFDIRRPKNLIQLVLKSLKQSKTSQFLHIEKSTKEQQLWNNKDTVVLSQNNGFLKKKFQMIYFLILYYTRYFYSGIKNNREEKQIKNWFPFYKKKISNIETQLSSISNYIQNRKNLLYPKQISTQHLPNTTRNSFSVQFLKKKQLIEFTRNGEFTSILEKRLYTEHIESILSKLYQKHTVPIGRIQLQTVKITEDFKSAQFLADEIAYFLEQKVQFRRIKNRILNEVKKKPFIKGIRITCSGRVGGRSKKAQRSRTDLLKYGQTSLHVFSSKIDFANSTAYTPSGSIGIKVWICFN